MHPSIAAALPPSGQWIILSIRRSERPLARLTYEASFTDPRVVLEVHSLTMLYFSDSSLSTERTENPHLMHTDKSDNVRD